MRREPRPAPRAGFTLIELLVVIAILALLAALITAGIARVRDAQQSKVSDQTLTKLQLALDKQWKAICDNCRDDRRAYAKLQTPGDFQKMVVICDNDLDRAEALWMYLNLRKSMPQTFAEVRSNVTLTGNGQTVTLPPSATFSQIQAKSAAGGTPFTEAAALLYLVLSQGGRGTNVAVDDATQGAQTSIDFGSGLSLPAFKDAFGTAVTFRRFVSVTNGELDQPPYVRSGLRFTDTLDPVGRLSLWPNRGPAQTAAGTVFNGKNRIATVISAGPDQTFDTVTVGGLEAFTANTDDAFGYRLTRQGNKGD